MNLITSGRPSVTRSVATSAPAKRRKLVFVSSHPNQVQAPVFRAASSDPDLDVEVWFCTRHGLDGEIDREFGREVKWDIPVLDGYSHMFLRNFSWRPSIYGFLGVLNLGVIGRLIKSERADVVVPGWKNATYLLAIWSAWLVGHRVLLRAESTAIGEKTKSGWKSSVRRFVVQYLLRPCIDSYLVVGVQNRLFYEQIGIGADQMIPSPYCVDNDRFQRIAAGLIETRAQRRGQLGLDDADVVFLYCGKLIPIKRPLDLLQAFHAVGSDKARLIVVGEGYLKQDLEHCIAEHDVKGVSFAGFVNQSEISDYYSIADVLVLCSESETWGMVINEAMNFGVPTIVSDTVGSASDLVIDTVTGRIFPKGDVRALADCMTFFLQRSPEQCKSMHDSCLVKVNEYSLSRVVESLKVDRK